jgi:aryl-alcohol dehydrogenase-like predicted oxidoreductase
VTKLASTDHGAEIALGTVQFGQDYGVSNMDGRTMPKEVAQILRSARDNGIRLLDTAATYGESETVLGGQRAPEMGFDIVTKAPPLQPGMEIQTQISQAMEDSLQRMGCPQVYAVLAHRCEDILGAHGEETYAALRRLKDKGLVSKIGASVYSPEQALGIIERFRVDIVQLPLNLFDQRMHTSGTIDKLASASIEVHARSCFLQGALLMDPEGLPHFLEPLQAKLIKLHRDMTDSGLTAMQGALAHSMHCAGVSAVIVGVCSVVQLDEILSASHATFPDGLNTDYYAVDDPAVIDPRRWPER